MNDLPCRFCGSPAVAVFDLPEGCICYPEDRQQALCVQHAIKANHIAGMTLKEDLTLGAKFTEWWLKRADP